MLDMVYNSNGLNDNIQLNIYLIIAVWLAQIMSLDSNEIDHSNQWKWSVCYDLRDKTLFNNNNWDIN